MGEIIEILKPYLYVNIIATVFYFATKKILGLLFRYTKNQIQMRTMPRGRVPVQRGIKPAEPYSAKVKKSYEYITQKKDGRRMIVIQLYVAGLVVCCILFTLEMYLFGATLFLFPYLIDLFVYISAKKSLAEREQLYNRMMVVKQSKMGLYSTGMELEKVFANEFTILEWDKERDFPKRIRIMIPPTFDSLQTENFMTAFNLNFGGDQAWAPDVDDKEYPGWCFTKNIVTLKADDPLPDRADWDASWLDPDQCAWSFFPLAIGTQGGTIMKDPKTGKELHILGTDFAGEQTKFAKKRGIWCSPEILASPQMMVLGATGGGKALATDTKLWLDS